MVGGVSFAEGVTFECEGSYFWGDVGDKFFSEAGWDVVFGGCDGGLTEGFLVCEHEAGGERKEHI